MVVGSQGGGVELRVVTDGGILLFIMSKNGEMFQAIHQHREREGVIPAYSLAGLTATAISPGFSSYAD